MIMNLGAANTYALYAVGRSKLARNTGFPLSLDYALGNMVYLES